MSDSSPNGFPQADWRLSRSVDVSLRYDLRFTERALDPANSALREAVGGVAGGPARLIAVIDSGVNAAWPDLASALTRYGAVHRDRIDLAAAPEVVAGGEPAKNDWTVFHRVAALIERAHICRHSYVLAIGGGAMLDAVGFAAATAHRGVRLIRMPTTTLSQADSGLGVKCGINAFGKKNFLGVFAPPWSIINDPQYLQTLESRDWRSGLSEIVKVGLIKDASLFAAVESAAEALGDRDEHSLQPLLRRSAELHARHILESGDPFELTVARPLDFGHWAAHKLEQMTGFEMRHGEAVAVGIAIDSLYSAEVGLLPAADARRIVDLLERLGFCMAHPALEGASELLDGMEEFREHLGGRLTIPLLRRIGESVDAAEMDADLVRRSIQTLRTMAEAAQSGAPQSSHAAG